MGAWGCGLFENDSVYNIMDAMEDLITLRPDGQEPFSADTIIDHVPYVDDTNDEVLAFLLAFYSDFGIVDKLSYYLPQLDQYLSLEGLSRWRDPQERLMVLQDLKHDCDFTVAGGPSRYANTEAGIKHWISYAKGH